MSEDRRGKNSASGRGDGENNTKGNEDNIPPDPPEDEAWTKTFERLAHDNRRSPNDLLLFLSSCPQDDIVDAGPELARAILDPCVDNVHLESKTVRAYADVLKRLLQNGSDQVSHQARALEQIVALAKAKDASAGFVSRMFELLYRAEIVLEAAYTLWANTASTSDLDACKGFLEYLKTAQEDSNDD